MPSRGVSVPIWLTGGKVATPTMRRSLGGPARSAPVPDALEDLDGDDVAERGADAVERVLTDDDLAGGPSREAAQQCGVEVAFHRGRGQTRDARPSTRNEPAVNAVAASMSGRSPNAAAS